MTTTNVSATPLAGVHALIVGPGSVDHSENGPTAQARLFGFDLGRIEEFALVHLQGNISDDDLDRLASRLLVDPVDGWWRTASDHGDELGRQSGVRSIDVGLRPGVTDRQGAELVRAAGTLGIDLESASVARRLLVHGSIEGNELERLADEVLHNDVIERWAEGLLTPAFTDPLSPTPALEHIGIAGLDTDGLVALGGQRRLGMSAPELLVVQKHFAGIGREPTDAELETLAQTWSEHCSHKTFRGLLSTPEGQIDGLLNSYLRAATDTIDAWWVRSAFVDNAGIVAFDEEHDLALKAETHNHPSALEPFGGSNTGVGGVVRDILGVSAKPIAITDILCFGPEATDAASLPDGVLHPRRVRSGVIAGIGDYGNKIGVPTVAGAILHDASYTTTPLVFAGCVGILPTGSNPTEPQPGDAVVVLGGAVGRDGVGGATFSSQTMGAETAAIAGSSVQIGDPIVEKGLIDVIVAARDLGLYTAVTDCGAGGLSSAVGEMGEKLGVEVDLATVPRKYPGLAPWEVWLSEAQERMVLAVPEPDEIVALARRWGVDATVIGHFTGDGRLVVRDGESSVVDLDMAFLHHGRPKLELKAASLDPSRPDRIEATIEHSQALLALLAHPSMRSNEDVVRTFDHEVLGGTVVRPYGGVEMDAPADGTVVIPPGTNGGRGMAIGIGVNVVIGRYDTGAMAWAATDEAVRNAVVAGADPDRLSLLDNFAWGNPTDEVALAKLIAACRGCHDAALAYGAPFVSGKDSLYNEFIGPDGQPDPVTPTLIITAVGVVEHLDKVPLTGVVAAGDDVWLVGPAAGVLGGSHLDDALGQDHGGPVPGADPEAATRHRELHRAIVDGLVRSAHDLAEGGLAVSVAEWALGGRLGIDIDPALIDGDSEAAAVTTEVLFGEGLGRYLVEVEPEDREVFAATVPSATRIGTITDRQQVTIGASLAVTMDEIVQAYGGSSPQ